MTTPRSLLITGGAGYVGSHVVLAYREAGYRVVVLDDLSTGARAAVPPDVAFVQADAGDNEAVGALIAEHDVAAVVHCAGSTVVPESVVHPTAYYRNNTAAGAALIEACIRCGVKRFVFASTAAVYGAPPGQPIAEDTPPAPAHPYGASKLMVERMLQDAAAAHDFRYAVLRFFNVAGADPRGRTGQRTRRATHLVHIACRAAAGRPGGVTVFGTDYATPDGTCVRDYIHVSDLAVIHVAVLRDLESGGGSRVFNCGYGRGFSVREVLDVVRAESGVSFPVVNGPRRAGDPSALVADPSRLRASLAWTPRYDDLGVIVRTALAWERRSVHHLEDSPTSAGGRAAIQSAREKRRLPG